MFRQIRLITAGLLLIVGCAPGTTGPGGTVRGWDKTMTKAQALARVEQLIQEFAVVITPEAKLELYQPSLTDDPCLDPTDGGPENRIIVSRSYFVRNIPKGQAKQIADRMKAYWEQHGHIVAGVSTNGTVITGRTRPDDFLVALSWTDSDVPILDAASPCIWPFGTPEPSPSV
ncbi:hypothetical protein [Acrocarpospora catenulata]|uniref:hypothetical protein n=1 Tax=Acrocarpospora catenulata TaxID=2836182 RepID=UPI001BDA1B43|nr:hypothetical protein [Acrocarpospora catenulata]